MAERQTQNIMMMLAKASEAEDSYKEVTGWEWASMTERTTMTHQAPREDATFCIKICTHMFLLPQIGDASEWVMLITIQ